jgi:hypothetical protein
MAEEKFKLPGSSYDELCKIIKSYGYFDKPFSLEEAAQVIKMNTSQISRNNGFLVAVNIIEGGKTKTTTDIGKRLAHALSYERGDEISATWREIVLSNEFLSKMFAAVRIRKGMDEATLQSHIAYSAGQQKNNIVMAGSRAVIDILKSSELIFERDGQLIPVESPFNEREQVTTKIDSSATQVPQISEGVVNITETGIISQIQSSGAVSVSIQIRLDVKPSELGGLGSKLRQLLDEIAGKPQTQPDTPDQIN